MSADSYQLGVDLGTTWTAAAVVRGGQVGMVGLGNRSAAIPSVVHLGADGAVLVGDAAERRAVAEPERIAREFKRRLGDPTPLRLGDTACAPDTLLGTLLDAVVARVTELEGGPPSHLVVTRPANWGGYKQDLFDECVTSSDVARSRTVSEPEAAAIAYAANERVVPGSLIAVYDLGGGTFDIAIMRKTSDGFSILGRPEGVERLGGIDVDEAVIAHVRTALGDALDALDLEDPATVAALARLRRDCVEAKEALSTDTEATIPVLLPGVQTEVRLTRAELERAIRPALQTSVDAMRRALAAAAITSEHLSTVLLVGGSSRIPLVAELVAEAFGRPVALDAHPKHAVATGAALVGAMEARSAPGSADARVIPFATAAATGAYDDRTVELRSDADPDPMITTTPRTALPATGAGAIAAAGTSPAGSGDDDDAPDDVPDWLLEARRDGGSSTGRRVLAGILAVLALTVIAVGAGALSARSGRDQPAGSSVAQPEAEVSEPAGGHASEAVAETGADDGADADQRRAPVAKQDAEASGAAGQDGTGGDDRADDGRTDPVTSSAGDAGGAEPTPSPGNPDGGAAPSPSPSPTPGSGGGGDGDGSGGGAAPSPSPSPTPGSGGGGDGGGSDPGGGPGSGSDDGTGSGTGDGSGSGTGDGSGGGGGGTAPDTDTGTDGSSAGGPAVPVAQG